MIRVTLWLVPLKNLSSQSQLTAVQWNSTRGFQNRPDDQSFYSRLRGVIKLKLVGWRCRPIKSMLFEHQPISGSGFFPLSPLTALIWKRTSKNGLPLWPCSLWTWSAWSPCKDIISDCEWQSHLNLVYLVTVLMVTSCALVRIDLDSFRHSITKVLN